MIKCSYTDLYELEKLVPNPRNDNDHKDEHVDLLAKVIKARGIRHPIIVSKRSGFIVAGHLRLLAAKKMGLDNFPIDLQDFESEADEYQFLSSDNNVARYAEFNQEKFLDNLDDLDIDVSNLDFEEVGLLDFELPEPEIIPQADEDSVPEIPEEPVTKRGDVWLLGNHRVMCGDSTMIDDVDKLMNGEKADMVFTDPPYGISVVGKTGTVGPGGEHAPPGAYREILGDKERFDVSFIKEYFSCDLFLWGANYYCHDLDETNSWIVWQKIESSLTFSDGELAWTTLKTPLRIYKHIWVGSMRAGVKELELKKRVHPTQKPVTLFIEIFTDLMPDHKHIVDLYLGSGSTLIACEKTNRKCYGMELDEKYCDVIVKRWQEYSGKEATLESTGEKFASV